MTAAPQMHPRGVPARWLTAPIVVVTGCYNHGHFLPECIASVQAQTVTDYLHVIVDDGSTDDTWAVAQAAALEYPRIVLLAQPENRGLAAAQNLAITAVPAPWYLKADADDTMHPAYLADILAAAEREPRANVIFSPAHVIGAGEDREYRYPTFNPRRMADRLMIPGPAALRRRLWERVGGFDERLRCGEDWDFWVRAERAGGLTPVQLPEARWHYRQHDGPRVSAFGMARSDALRAHLRRHTRRGPTLDWRTAPAPDPCLTERTH